MFIAVIVLIAAGFAFSLGGIYWGALATAREYNALKGALPKLESILELGLPPEEQDRRRYEVLAPSSGWGDIEYFREHVRFAVLSLAVEDLKWPAALTALGILLSSLGGLLALWA